MRLAAKPDARDAGRRDIQAGAGLGLRSTARLDKGRKREIYEKAGVDYLWYADPALHTIDAFAHDGKGYKLAASVGCDKRVKLAPFTHAIDLAKLWQR